MIIEVVPFVIVLWKKQKKEPLFIASFITLAVIPVYKISYFNDFSMRASLPALFVISVMFTELLAEMFAEDKQRIRKAKRRPKRNLSNASLFLRSQSYVRSPVPWTLSSYWEVSLPVSLITRMTSVRSDVSPARKRAVIIRLRHIPNPLCSV